MKGRPIFVTGVPRCGSSWVGDVLSTAARVRYNYEAFNPTRHPYLTRHHVYLAAQDDDPFLRRAADAAFAGRVRFHQFLRGVRWGYGWRTIRPFDRVLVKDPTALFMAEWVAANYGAAVVVIMRHPCAFASSIHRLGWPADPVDFLEQPRLMEDWLGPHESLIRECRRDFWTRVAAFWAAAHVVLLGQLARHPEWRLRRYEELCVRPREEFGALCDWLGLRQTPAMQRILEHSTTTADTHAKSTRRRSTEMVDVWRRRLTPAQIDAVLGTLHRFGISDYSEYH